MATLKWDEVGEKWYELGVDHGVLYPWDQTLNNGKGGYGNGVAWNGLTAVNESPEGGEPNDLWADNIKYASIMSAEDFGFTIEAYTYPDEFAECDGSATLVKGVKIAQQVRKMFGFSYRTKVGNDTAAESDDGYKIHLVYGCMASPSDRDHETINDSPDAEQLSWEIKTTPVPVTGFKPTAHLIVDSRDFTTTQEKEKLTAFETTIYGGDNTEPTLPLPDAVKTALT